MKLKTIFMLMTFLMVSSLNKALAQNKKDTVSVTIVEPIQPEPEFPGGYEKFKEFLRSNLHKVQGTKGKKLLVSFVVEKDGRLTHFKVERGINDKANREAIRVMRLSPKWKPVIVDERPERSKYNVPIVFPQ